MHGINLALIVNWDCSVNKTVICRSPGASVAEVINYLMNKGEDALKIKAAECYPGEVGSGPVFTTEFPNDARQVPLNSFHRWSLTVCSSFLGFLT